MDKFPAAVVWHVGFYSDQKEIYRCRVGFRLRWDVVLNVSGSLLNSKGIEDITTAAAAYPDTSGQFSRSDLKAFGFWNLTVGGYNN